MDAKPLEFIGNALNDLRLFPTSARQEAGYQLDKVQNGKQPSDFKPMNTIGAGVQEIRIHDESGQFRVVYVARFERAVYVLHCFHKKTQKTSQKDIEIAARRYKKLVALGLSLRVV